MTFLLVYDWRLRFAENIWLLQGFDHCSCFASVQRKKRILWTNWRVVRKRTFWIFYRKHFYVIWPKTDNQIWPKWKGIWQLNFSTWSAVAQRNFYTCWIGNFYYFLLRWTSKARKCIAWKNYHFWANQRKTRWSEWLPTRLLSFQWQKRTHQ